MTLSRYARQTLAVAVSLALLRVDAVAAATYNRTTASVTPVAALPFAATDVRRLSISMPRVDLVGATPATLSLETASQAGVFAAGLGHGSSQPAALAGAPAGAAVARHPVIDALNQLQAKGITLPEAALTHKDAQGFEKAAEALPEGPMRAQLMMMSKAVTAAKGGSGAQLDAAFDGSAQKAAVADSIWTRMSKWSWIPSGLAKRFAARGERAQPKKKAIDPSSLEVPLERLRWTPSPELLPNSTRDIPTADKQIIGQDRALKSIYYGLKMPGANYNLFVSGPDGSGRETAVRHIVPEIARMMATPDDLVAVTNFENPQEPLILKLPAGSAPKLAAGVDKFVEAYGKMLPQILMSKQVNDMRKGIKKAWEASVELRQNHFDESVESVRSDGKFGFKMMPIKRKDGLGVGAVLTIKNAQGEEQDIPNQAKAQELIAAGLFTEAEFQSAVKDVNLAARPFSEYLETVIEESEGNAQLLAMELAKINEALPGARIGGRFGVQIVIQESESGMDVGYVATYLNPLSKKMSAIESEEELEKLIGDGVFTREEWQQAVKDGKAASNAYVEAYETMMLRNKAEADAANQKIAQINQQIAAQVVNQLAPALVSAVSKNRHDTPEHKIWEKKAAKMQEDFAKKVAKVRIGQYGIYLETEGGQLAVGLTHEVDGKMVPLSPEEAQALLDSGAVTKDAIQKAVRPLAEELNAIMEKIDEDHRAVHAKDAPVTPEEQAAANYVKKLLGVAAGNYGVFLQSDDEEEKPGKRKIDPSELFRVSVLTSNAAKSGAPVIWEMAPSYERLFGTAEDNSKPMLVPGVGVLRTQGPGGPTLKSGSFLRANGGFLIMNVMDVLKEPGSWQALMQAIRNGQAEIAEGGMMGMLTGKGEKYNVPAKVKVVLLGSPSLKMLLRHYDEDYARAFNAQAEFEPTLAIGPEAVDGYLQFMAKVIASNAGEIYHHTRDAIAALMEYAARLVDSNTKLTAQFGALASLMKEASLQAKEQGRTEVKREDIDAALALRSDSEDVYVRRMMEAYKNDIMKVKTSGRVVGQINGLAVMGSFGVPMQIQATVTANNGGFRVTSSDKAAGTTGSSWNKSFADVEAYLMNLLGKDAPLAGTLNISFAQNYGGIDGDSATTTMIYAALSAYSGVPINQAFANTGSASPLEGVVQAIGGANEKTEGFFTVAAMIANMVNKAYLDGQQSVIVPNDNVGDLMLKPEVVQAVREGKFKIYRAATIEQGMELITGVPFAEVVQKAKARSNELRAAARK